MRSVSEFLLVALLVTITPGPATATIVRVAARDGRRAATATIVGNCAGVLIWGLLSAVGVSSLILASHLAYDGLRLLGAAALVVMGARSLVGRHRAAATPPTPADAASPKPAGWRTGLVTSIANPKLAVFFIALFPQFLAPGSAVLPYAIAMAGTIVALDLVWYSALALAVDRVRGLFTTRVQRRAEQVTGAVMLGLGLRLAVEAR